MRIPHLCLLCLISLLSACQSMPEHTPEQERAWQQQQQQLQQLQTWFIRGSVAVNSQKDGWNARFFWQQQGETYQLRITGPLGQGTLLLKGQPGQVSLRSSDGQQWQADTPEQLLQQATGVYLPVSHLLYWIRGLPTQALELDTYQLTPDAHIEHMQQATWNIAYSQYKSWQSYVLPRKIRLENADYLIQVAITEWRDPASSPSQNTAQTYQSAK